MTMRSVARQIVGEMPRGQPISTATIARRAGLDEGEAVRHLDALEDVGVVEEVDDPLASERVWELPHGGCDE